MTIRRRCTERNCKNGRKCLEHLRFDVMFRGKRYRIPANEFAIPRIEAGKQREIQSMEEARDWERLFIGEIKAGRNPRRPSARTMQAGSELRDVSAFLDAYMERCVKPAGLRSIAAVRSCVGVLKEHIGELSLAELEDPDVINQFKTDSEYAEDVEIATMHRVLETLRAAMNWGMAQTPPLFNRSPFHRFGVRLSGNRPCQIGIPGATAKDKENRRIPFNPKGRLAAILKRRSELGPDGYVFGSANGSYQPNIQTAWETLRLLANGVDPKPGREERQWNRD